MVTLTRRVLRSVTVMVDVDDHNQTGFMRHLDQLRYAVQPTFLNRIGRCVTDMAHPGHRDTHGFETGFGYAVESLLGSGFVTPTFLVRTTVVVSVHLVTEVPSDTHGHTELYSLVVHRTSFLFLRFTGG